MTAFTGSFELRRLLIKWSRGPSGGTQEDVDVMTMHFVKLTSGSPDASWSSADYAALEARLDTWWTACKVAYPPFHTLAEYRWYKDGPSWDPIGAAPPNPADRVTARSVVGTNSISSGVYAPQLAMTITEVTAIRKRWGRMYLPAPAWGNGGVSNSDGAGRISSNMISILLTPTVALYNGARADNRFPVVWSKAKNAYTTAGGVAIPAHAATAYTVDSLQMDNLWDVVRSRRYDGPTQRSVTVLT